MEGAPFLAYGPITVTQKKLKVKGGGGGVRP